MLCRACQRENPDDASFCAGCGAPLAGPSSSEEPPDAAVLAARAAAATAAVLNSLGGAGVSTIPPSIPPSLAAGRYRVSRLLGEGAMKRVYAGHDDRLDRAVAIAALKTEELDEAGRLRLRREARAMGRLGDHPNVVPIYDVFEEGQGIYVVAQLMAGGELMRRIHAAPGGRLAVDEAIAIAIQICRALEHAHGQGVVHRDLEPANIWLTDDGTAKLGDFGLAVGGDRTRLTVEGLVLGTVAYMAPEQFVGRAADQRSDLYALGATLYEMLTGRPPFTGDDVVAVISQHLHTAPVAPSWHNPGVTRPLDQIVLDLLAKDPEARPPSAAVVRGRLAALASLSASGPVVEVGANPLDRLASGVFVGRAAEVERLRHSLEEALSGKPRVLLLLGEPGIGKTRIAEELGTYARLRGARVLWGRCWEGDGAPPFWPWVQVVRAYLRDHEPRDILADLGAGAADVAHLVPQIHEVLPGLHALPRLEPEQARFRLFDAIVGLLRNASRRRPIMVVLDDLHWADEASLVLLQFLVREIGPARLLVVGTYRDVDLRRRRHPLVETLADLARHEVGERVVLGGLSQEEVARFIAQSTSIEPPPDLVRAVFRETEGNPFFVHEVVRLLAAEGRLTEKPSRGSWSVEIPREVRDVVGRRLNRLSEACNETLAVAAVLGREFDLRELARVSGATDAALVEALDDAIAARILVEGPEHRGRYRFAHALVRETLYDELSSPRRVLLHGLAGEVIQQLHGDTSGARLADIAHHFSRSVEAGDPERAIAACVRASQWASSHQAWEDAALHLERAVELLETVDDPDPFRRCDLIVTLAETQALGTDAARTQRTAMRGFELAREAGLPRHLARAALAYGAHFLYIESGRVDATMTTLLDDALAALGNDDPALRASLLLRLAQELTLSSDVERIGALLDEATRLAEAIGDPALQAAVALGAQFGFRFGHEDEALQEGRRLVALARDAGNAAIEQRSWSQVLWGALWLGRIGEARQAIEEERRLGEELRTPFARYLPIRHDSMIAVLEGRFDDARTINRRAEEIAAAAVGTTNLAQWTGGQRIIAGRLRGATMRPNLSRAYVDQTGHPLLRALLSAVFASAGERNDARRELGILAADDFGGIARDESWLATLMVAADVTYELEEARYAAALYDLMLPWKGRFPCVGPIVACLGPVDLRLGQLALLLGRNDAAEEHLREAIALSSATGARPFLAEARAALGAVLLARGGAEARDAAAPELGLAGQLAAELGMQRVLAEVRASGLVP